jgi:hypothetical protein
MTRRQHKVQTQLGGVAVRIFTANDRMNQILIEHLDPAAWRAKPPGKSRTIAAIFTHMPRLPSGHGDPGHRGRLRPRHGHPDPGRIRGLWRRAELQDEALHLAEDGGFEIFLAIGVLQSQKVQQIRIAEDHIGCEPVLLAEGFELLPCQLIGLLG